MTTLPFQTPEAKAKAAATRAARAAGQLPPLPTLRNLKAAVSLKCQECMGGGIGLPTPIADIRGCTSAPLTSAPCPLWEYRPFQ